MGTERELALSFHDIGGTMITNLEVLDRATCQWKDYLIAEGLGLGRCATLPSDSSNGYKGLSA